MVVKIWILNNTKELHAQLASIKELQQNQSKLENLGFQSYFGWRVHPLARGCTYIGLMGATAYLDGTRVTLPWMGAMFPGQGVYLPWIDGHYGIPEWYHPP